ncbi:avidin-like protein [Columba livia]|nr:avidin-like protein [Columba livia]
MAGLCCNTNTNSTLLQCQPAGYWINKQGHILIIWPVDQGSFNGYYLKNESYPLKGLRLPPNQNRQIILGFVVTYSSGSIRVFTGQCSMENTGKEVLKTIWLELSLVGNIEYYWIPTMHPMASPVTVRGAQSPSHDLHVPGYSIIVPTTPPCSLRTSTFPMEQDFAQSGVVACGPFPTRVVLGKRAGICDHYLASALSTTEKDEWTQDSTADRAQALHCCQEASNNAFVGQCFVDFHGKETLETMWLMWEEVLSCRDAWKATRTLTLPEEQDPTQSGMWTGGPSHTVVALDKKSGMGIHCPAAAPSTTKRG